MNRLKRGYAVRSIDAIAHSDQVPIRPSAAPNATGPIEPDGHHRPSQTWGDPGVSGTSFLIYPWRVLGLPWLHPLLGVGASQVCAGPEPPAGIRDGLFTRPFLPSPKPSRTFASGRPRVVGVCWWCRLSAGPSGYPWTGGPTPHSSGGGLVMKATVRVLISVLALVVAGAVTAPAASGLSPATRNVAAVQAEPDAGAVVSVTPARVADSRAGLQIPGAVAGFGTVGVQVAGRGGIPGSGAAAVVATVTVTGPQTGGHLTVWPSGTAMPGTSNLNFQAGQTVANTVIVRLGARG